MEGMVEGDVDLLLIATEDLHDVFRPKKTFG